MTVWETIAIFVLIPLALYGLMMLLTLWPKVAARTRYRPGGSWDHEPVWWTGNPDGVGVLAPQSAEEGQAARSTARGGARGNW